MVVIITYKETWPHEFQEIAGELRRALQALAIRIDHIGSTSVPGLAAKDVIDIQITVAGFDERLHDHFTQAIAKIGYAQAEGVWVDHRPPLAIGPDSDWEKWVFRPPPTQRRTHIHVRVQDRPNFRFPLLFRDYLRCHPGMAEAYAELKRRLAAQLADPTTYPTVKDPAVDLIYFAAEEWAEVTGWHPGQSDA